MTKGTREQALVGDKIFRASAETEAYSCVGVRAKSAAPGSCMNRELLMPDTPSFSLRNGSVVLQSRDCVGSAGPFSQLGHGLSAVLSKWGARDLSWGVLPSSPSLGFCFPDLCKQTPLEGRAVHAGSRHLTTLPPRSSPMALATLPPHVLKMRKGNYILR